MPRKLSPRPALLLGAALLALAGGCLPPWDYARHEREQEEYRRRDSVSFPPFDEAEYVPFQKSGTGVIVGIVGYKTRKGIYASPPDTEVTLDPATGYGRIWWEGPAMISGRLPPDPRFLQYRRTTTLDAQGEFRFEGLPPGSYYVRSIVTHWHESVSPRDPRLWDGRRVWPWGWSSVSTEQRSSSGTSVTVTAGHTPHVVVCNDWYNSTTRCGWVQEPQP